MSGKAGNLRDLRAGPRLGFLEGRVAAAGMRRCRKAARLSPEDLAERLGTGAMWVKQREGGSIRMTRAEVERVAAELGTDYAGLTGGAQ